jgi:hypothetical protein
MLVRIALASTDLLEVMPVFDSAQSRCNMLVACNVGQDRLGKLRPEALALS